MPAAGATACVACSCPCLMCQTSSIFYAVFCSLSWSSTYDDPPSSPPLLLYPASYAQSSVYLLLLTRARYQTSPPPSPTSTNLNTQHVSCWPSSNSPIIMSIPSSLPSFSHLAKNCQIYLHRHRKPFACAALVFKNRLLGLANFLGGKMDPFFRILIFSYPPFRLV